jgi:hypothetical protein
MTIDKKELLYKVAAILHRVDEASNGARNTDDWHDKEDNMGAPKGLSYWEWIEQAESELNAAIHTLDI